MLDFGNVPFFCEMLIACTSSLLVMPQLQSIHSCIIQRFLLSHFSVFRERVNLCNRFFFTTKIQFQLSNRIPERDTVPEIRGCMLLQGRTQDKNGVGAPMFREIMLM